MSIVAYAPDDLTVSATADTTLAALQQHIGTRGQWLPIDPPHADRVTIGDIINRNLSGPRRYGYGTIRERLLAIRVELADGTCVKAGAPVVKSVAGYDLCRLFTGAQGELGAVREATFKIQSLPEAEQFVEARFDSAEAACGFVEQVDTSPLTPVVVDLHNAAGHGTWMVVIGFAGPQEEVEWQRREVAKLATVFDSSLDYETRFWSAGASDPVRKSSVLPSKLCDALKPLRVPLVARAGNGVIYYRGGPEPPKMELPVKLMQALKNEFDPANKFPSITA